MNQKTAGYAVIEGHLAWRRHPDLSKLFDMMLDRIGISTSPTGNVKVINGKVYFRARVMKLHRIAFPKPPPPGVFMTKVSPGSNST